MKLKYLLSALLAGVAIDLHAAVPPAEQLLPADTLFVINVPDWTKSQAAYFSSPGIQFWKSPEMKPFADKFMGQVEKEITGPLEKELGIKLSEYSELIQGQTTLGVTMKDASGGLNFGVLLLIDVKDKGESLKTKLADFRKKMSESGKTLKSTRIRDQEFTTLSLTSKDIEKTFKNAFPKLKEAMDSASDSSEKLEMIIGQADSLLVIGNDAKDIEKVLVRQSGGQISCLAEQAEFKASQGMFRESQGFFWLNFKPLIAMANKKITEMAAAAASNPMAPKPDKVIAALGWDGLSSLSGTYSASPEGEGFEMLLGVPEAGRKGLFRLFSFEAKDSAPPAFVPADAAKFSRIRLDGRKLWGGLETMLTEMSPELAGLLQMALGAAGKDKDPNFDLKKMLIDNLGDDIISFQKAPKNLTIEEVSSPPTIVLLGSPKAEQLGQAIKSGAGLLVAPNAIKEREFLGRKVVTLNVPGMPGTSDDGPKNVSFATSGNYVAFSTDEAMLEGYLRSAENKPKALADTAGLTEASQKVGGTSTGFWSYENQSETMRQVLEMLRKSPDSFEKLFELNPVAQSSGSTSSEFKAWLDFTQLPPFEKVAKYFSFAVYSVGISSDGFSFRYHSPTPAGLKK